MPTVLPNRQIGAVGLLNNLKASIPRSPRRLLRRLQPRGRPSTSAACRGRNSNRIGARSAMRSAWLRPPDCKARRPGPPDGFRSPIRLAMTVANHRAARDLCKTRARPSAIRTPEDTRKHAITLQRHQFGENRKANLRRDEIAYADRDASLSHQSRQRRSARVLRELLLRFCSI